MSNLMINDILKTPELPKNEFLSIFISSYFLRRRTSLKIAFSHKFCSFLIDIFCVKSRGFNVGQVVHSTISIYFCNVTYLKFTPIVRYLYLTVGSIC